MHLRLRPKLVSDGGATFNGGCSMMSTEIVAVFALVSSRNYIASYDMEIDGLVLPHATLQAPMYGISG